MQNPFRELRRAAVLLSRNRRFAASSIGLLALGIGAVSGIFVLFDNILLRPLPYPEADRIVVVEGGSHTGTVLAPNPRCGGRRDSSCYSNGFSQLDQRQRPAVAGNRARNRGFFSPSLALAHRLVGYLTHTTLSVVIGRCSVTKAG